MEQYYRESHYTYEKFVYECRRKLLIQVEERECEHCRAGVMIFPIPIGSESVKADEEVG